MQFAGYIAMRYLRSRRHSRFLSRGSVTAVVGIAIGVTVLNIDCDYYDETETIEAGASVIVARKGCFSCTVEGAVTKGAPVFVRTTAAGAEVLGALRGDADGGDAIALPGAQFGSTTDGAGLALVRLNLPQ